MSLFRRGSIAANHKFSKINLARHQAEQGIVLFLRQCLDAYATIFPNLVAACSDRDNYLLKFARKRVQHFFLPL